MRAKYSIVSVLAAVALGSAAAVAAPVSITVPNYSFETTGGWTSSQPDWNNGVGVVSEVAGASKYDQVGGFLPAPADLTHVAVLTGYVNWTGSLWSDGLGTLSGTGGAASSVYTLTVAVGWPNTQPGDVIPSGGTPSISLLLGANVLQTTPATPLTQGAFSDFQATYTVLGTESATDQLSIRFNWTNATNPATFAQASFDNVRLTVDAVPEPATAGLLALAASAGLLVRRRRA